jgi:spoIIIJ-associated protein
MVASILEIEDCAPTVEGAVDKALKKLGCTRAEVETTIVKMPSSGLFGLFGLLGARPARVRVRLTDRAFVARALAEKLLVLCGLSGQVEVEASREQIDLKICGNDSSQVIGRQGQTIDALQSLVVLLTDRQIEDRTPIVLDIGNYRARRASSLRRLARRLSAQVRRSGRPLTVQPLPPEERRILHLALEEETGIESRSVGHGYERKMVVSSGSK